MFKHNTEVKKLTLINFFLNLFFLSPVSVFFFQHRGLNYFEILALESVLVFFIFLFEVPTGIFADKYGRKKSIIIGSVLIALEPLIFIFANNFFLFALAFALSGIGLAFLSGTIEAFIYDSLDKKNKDKMMQKAMGSYYSASLVALVIAPIIGSYLAKDLLNSQFILVIIMTSCAMMLGVLLTLFLKDTQKKKVKKENAIKIFKDGIKTIKSNKSLMRIVYLAFYQNHFFIPYFIYTNLI
jgi:MFS family permease